MLDEQSAWAAVDEAAGYIRAWARPVRSQVAGVVVAGSLVRGDFVEDSSDVDVYTILCGEIAEPHESEAYAAVAECFDRATARFRGFSGCPSVWDGVCLSEARLPKSTEDATRQRFKMLGIYLFDLAANHKTIYGRDVFSQLPTPPDPKDLVAARLEWLCKQMEAVFQGDPRHHFRIAMAGVEAVKALQLYFAKTPTIDKRDIPGIYARVVPSFGLKGFGLDVWRSYVGSRYPDGRQPTMPTATTLEFLSQAREMVSK